MADDPYARIAELEAENASARQRELIATERAIRAEAERDEALEQQTALGEVLRVIASSPRDLDSVMQALVESINQLCRADGVTLNQVEVDMTRLLVATGAAARERTVGTVGPLTRQTTFGRAILDGKIMRLADRTSPESQAEFPRRYASVPASVISVPL